MRRFLHATSLLLVITSCAAPDAPRAEELVASGTFETQRVEEPVEGGLLVRVVDVEGRPVAGAEVRAPGASASPRPVTEAEQRFAQSKYLEILFTGDLGRVDRFGLRWRTDERGETRVPAIARDKFIVARCGDRWGVSRPEITPRADRFTLGTQAESTPTPSAPIDTEIENSSARTIVIERDESIRVTCKDREGRPGVGAFVGIAVADPIEKGGYGETQWGGFVDAADGTFEIPHAQYWRSTHSDGLEFVIGGVVLWANEMFATSTRPFPDSTVSDIDIEVALSGAIDVRADWCTPETMGDLRWIDGPTLADDLDDLPELPINPSRALPFSVPLGQRYEIVVPVHGLADVRVVFDGPKRAGERVEVVLPPPGPSAQITGRLMSANGTALVRHQFEVVLERNGVRIEPEEFFLVTQDDGRFSFEVPPGDGGVLHVELTGSVMGPGPEFSATISLRNGPPDPRPSARVELTRELPAGVVEVGDIVCVAPR